MQGRGRGGEVVQRKRVKRRQRRKKYQEEKTNGWWVSQENEGVEGKGRKQRQAEMTAAELWVSTVFRYSVSSQTTFSLSCGANS